MLGVRDGLIERALGAGAPLRDAQPVGGGLDDLGFRHRRQWPEVTVLHEGSVLAEGSLDVAGLTADNLEWRAIPVNVAGVSIVFAETRLPSARFGDAHLLVGQRDDTTIALVTSDGSVNFALRELTASDLDKWIRG